MKFNMARLWHLLSLIISKKSITGEIFYVYVQPLLEELHYGGSIEVRVIDAANYLWRSIFESWFMCMFTMNDYPTFEIGSGNVTKDYLDCLCCSPSTVSWRSSAVKKNHLRQSTPNVATKEHHFPCITTTFYGGIENKTPSNTRRRAPCEEWSRVREDWIIARATPTHS